MITNQDLINIGFEPIPHYTVTNSVTYHLGRRTYLSAGSVGTPNEMLFIYSLDDDNDKLITDIITLHNYDYDGYLTVPKVLDIIRVLKFK